MFEVEFVAPYSNIFADNPDIVFNVCHGAPGETGLLAAYCQISQTPFTGSGAAASQVAMHKVVARQCMADAGVPVAEGMAIDKLEQLQNFVAAHSGKACLKPAVGGSSLGVELIGNNHRTAADAFVRAKSVAANLLAEEFLYGEYTVGILGGESLPMLEITTPEEFYNYRAKYEAGTTTYTTPNLPASEISQGCAIARQAFAALGCCGWGRVDMMRAQGNHPDTAWRVLEVNVAPGMTSHSLVPKAAAQAGITFSQLVAGILDQALQDSHV